MLPPYLSNDICSLKPEQDRLTFSIIFEINLKSQILNYWIGKTIIHSDKRFTYQEAQSILDQKQGLFYDELFILNELAKKLRKKRFDSGSIHFHTQEIQFQLDQHDNLIDFVPKSIYETHHLVEEWMLLANVTIANFIKKKKVAFVYRTHDEPDAEKFGHFTRFLATLDVYDSKKKLKPNTQDIQWIHQKAKNTPQENLIHQFSIRTMAKAKYTSLDSKHFGLGFDFYCV